MQWIVIAVLATIGSFVAESAVADSMPPVDKKGQSHYTGKYAQARKHKAYVIAPGGGWQWKDKFSSADEAVRAALEKCQKRNDVCVAYDIDGERVFDEENWAAVLAPYPNSSANAPTEIGASKGDLFPDLAFKTKEGEKKYVSDFRGKLMLINIWASWCPGCQTEMPSLNALYEMFRDTPDLEFVAMASMENETTSYQYAESRHYTIPVYHTGVRGKKNRDLPLKDGDSINMKKIGKYIPSTYLVDRNGAVIWKRVGEFNSWQEFAPQLTHAIRNAD